jgi:hypothetical protein
MSSAATEQAQESRNPSYKFDEEQWFTDRSRERKRPLKTSPTTPPPPLGDPLADGWFR